MGPGDAISAARTQYARKSWSSPVWITSAISEGGFSRSWYTATWKGRRTSAAPRRPLDYSGVAGLLWAMNGGTLVQLHRDWAVIDLPVQMRERVFYRRTVDPAKITLPWVKAQVLCRM